MKKLKKLMAILVIFALSVAVFAACAPAQTPADATANTDGVAEEQTTTATGEGPVLKVGFLCDMTGVNSWYGGVMNTLGRSVVDRLNAEGIEGFAGIEVTTYDTRSDQPTACEQVTRAKTEDGMDIVWGSWVEAQLIPFTNEFASIPYVMNNTTGLKPLNADARWVIMPSASSWDYGVACANFMKENDCKSWAIVGQGWGEGWLDAWAEGVKYETQGTDIECLWDEEVSSDKIDWSAEINEWKQLQPDVVMVPNTGAGVFSIVKQMKDAGYWPKYLIFDPMAAGDYTTIKDALSTDEMMGMISVTAGDIQSDAWVEFANESVELGYYPYGFSSELVDTLNLIKVAAEIVGPEDYKDPEKLMEALRQASYTDGAMAGGLGPFRENGLRESVTVTLVECMEGPPDWTDQVDYHWEPIYSYQIDKQLSLEEAVEVWPDLGTRLGV